MPPHKKIHSCKPHKATLRPKLAREYFFLPPKEEFFPPLFFLFFFRHRTGIVHNRTDIASNVDCLGQSMSGLDTLPLRMDRRASGNSGFKKLAVHWLIEHLCFVSSSVLADSLVLRNRQLLKPAKRV